MGCSNRNILKNGGFRQGLRYWKGKNVRLVKNPVYANDVSILMKKNGVLSQAIREQFESGCAYYLYFRILPLASTKIFATVTYYDASMRLLRSTPLMIRRKMATKLRFQPYFTIVPPPPRTARLVSVVFWTQEGTQFLDYIQLASHAIYPG